ncbi:MAG: dual specificity protein phosphatase family protein, partial [Candidatus Nanohaloarchaeota archaeon QJJ-9]|nr:dual specificity protein phosphatase family protein [Candidatus Nanohaloarchaeota archaeon QJJ-9]
KEKGIDLVINLSKAETPEIEETEKSHIPMDDSKLNEQQDFDRAVERLEKALEKGKTVLVHCKEGVSRSIAVTAATIARKEEKSLRQTLNEIEKKRPVANPHPYLVNQAKKSVRKG